ncbi:glycoside hydrolase domain-containing protein [Streptomyces sp. NPDC020983]|uniref:glycoside hydrolase domain-containing protein n=1 Tax=Streptomyces sp. NPDC020983 TaxID=3365106 RepID=UPI00379A2EAE
MRPHPRPTSAGRARAGSRTGVTDPAPPVRGRIRPGRRLGAVAAGAAALLAAVGLAPAHADSAGPAATRTVAYQGYRFKVPAGWQVVDLTEQPSACVRFDRHALYLGTPGAAQDCPAHLIGRTDAVLVEPAPLSVPAGSAQSAADHELTVAAPGVRVTAAYATDPALVRGVLADSGLPATAALTTAPAATAAVAALPPSVTDFTGKGFEACSAPSGSAMQAWKESSPYGSVGIYIGGPTLPCRQPNLTASWVQQQAAAGWHFMPLYDGPQAHSLTSPAAQGKAAAADAIADAEALGFSPGSVLYDDMEEYAAGYRDEVLAFVSAWDAELHARGWSSGVYGSASSVVTDLASEAGSDFVQPDVLFIGHWNGVADTAEPAVPAGNWTAHQRIHQYAGQVTETHGGVTIAIDRDVLDVGVSSAMSRAAAVGDVTGDGRPDLVAVGRPTGNLYRYSGPDFSGDTRVQIGTGWNAFQTLTGVGDLNGDGHDDLLAQTPSGDLYRYWGPDFRGGTRTQVGTGWNSMGNVTAAGDLDGDGTPDLIAVKKSTGALYRYSGPDFSGDTRVQIGTGWNVYHTLAAVGDQTGDGRPDILATGTDGALYRYAGPDFSGPAKVQVGDGWDTMTRLVSPGDLTGSATPDLLAVKIGTGTLYRYAGPGLDGGSRTEAGTGW